MRRFSVSLVGRIAAALMQVAIVALLARSLGVAGFGVFVVVSSVSLGVMSFADLGMAARLLRGRRSSIEDSTLSVFAISRVIIVVLLVTVALLWAGSQELALMLVASFALYTAGEATGDLGVAMLQGAKRSVAAVSLLCGRRILTLLALVVLPGESAVTVACLLGASAGFLSFAYFVVRRWTRPRSFIALIRENGGIILSGGASSAAQFDAALVAQAAGAVTAGLYGSATRLFNPINLAVVTLIQVFVPEIVSVAGADRLRVFRRVRNIVAGFALLILSFAWTAPIIVEAIYGPAFAGAAPVAIAVFVSAAISAIGQAYMAWYYATRVPVGVTSSLWIAVMLGLLIIGALSYLAGTIGAAIGLVVMHILSTAAIVLPWRSAAREYL